MKKYLLKVFETRFYTMEVEAENVSDARKQWENYKSITLSCDRTEDGILSVTLKDNQPVAEKDVHTEHCCLTCGCKYGSETCTVITEQKSQSYTHDELCV